MIYIKMNGFKYNNEIFELIRSFFHEKEIREYSIENQEDLGENLLIDFNLIKENGKLYGKTQIYLGDKILAVASEDISKIYINREYDKTVKAGVKKSIYTALSYITSIEHPWGVLTGIRPGKIVHDLMEKDTQDDLIMDILTKEYLVRDDKAKLITQISKRQQQHIYPIVKEKYSLYVGIPFCPTRCTYCSFASFPTQRYSKYIDEYVGKLIYEIKEIKELMKDYTINTVYIGGGTPTAIPAKSLERVIAAVYDAFGYSNINEMTVEAGRPDTIDEDVLSMMSDYQVHRLSINPQTMNDKTLNLIGRNHTSEDIIRAYNLAREKGFENINMDLILGLPEETINDLETTLKKIKILEPDSITVHTLAVKRGSAFKQSVDKQAFNERDTIEAMIDKTALFAEENDLHPYYLYRQKEMLGNYENVGYAKEGKECIYNISIMEERESIVGAGVGATTKMYYPDGNRIERIFNFKDLREYLMRTEELIDRKRKLILGGIR